MEYADNTDVIVMDCEAQFDDITLVFGGDGNEFVLSVRLMSRKSSPESRLYLSGSGHTTKQFHSFEDVTHMQEGTPKMQKSHERFPVGCSSPCMRVAEHLTALRAWCTTRCLCLVCEAQRASLRL